VSVDINEFPSVLEAGVVELLVDSLLLVAVALIAHDLACAVQGEQKKDDA
jgi:hypothetical protein